MPATGNLTEAYRTIFHEYSHFIVRTQFPGYCPPWFNEGLAELLSTAQFRADRIVLPAAQDVLYTLRAAPWIPAEQLFKVTPESSEYRSHQLAPSFYAQSWLAMNYAFVVNPAFLRQTVEYVVRLNRGEHEDAAAEAAFKRDFAEIDRELRTYASGRTFRDGEIMTASQRRFASMPARLLSAPESARILGELGLRVQHNSSRVEPLVLAATRGNPTDPRALAAQANMLALSKNTAEAEVLVGQFAALADPPDADALVLIGDAHEVLAFNQTPSASKLATASEELLSQLKSGDADPRRLRIARGFYEKALKAAPESIAAAHGFATTCMPLGECLEETIAHLVRAQSAAPSNWLLAYDLAAANEINRSAGAALQQWQLVARLAQSPQLRDEALARIEAASKPGLER